jgi:hypothetical protein
MAENGQHATAASARMLGVVKAGGLHVGVGRCVESD